MPMRIILLIFFASLLNLTPAISQNAKIDSIKNSMIRGYISVCNEMNAQMPIDIDETLTITHVLFYNWTFSASYILHIASEDLTSEDKIELKKELSKNALTQAKRMAFSGNYMSKEDMMFFMKTTGLRYKQTYHDDNGLFICSIVVGYNELFGQKPKKRKK